MLKDTCCKFHYCVRVIIMFFVVLNVLLISVHGFLDPVTPGVGDVHSQILLAEKIGILEQTVAAMKNQNDKIPNLEAEITALKSEVPKLQAEVATLKKENVALLKLQNQTTGTVYTRWGRKSCPSNGTEMIYTGYTVGSKTSTAKFLCLPKTPVWDRYVVGLQSGSSLYVAQYDFNDDKQELGYLDDNHTNDYFIPCTVCNHLSHRSIYMIPGRNDCQNGWNLEYKGYLMSGHATSETICVDGNPERLGFDTGGTNGLTVFHTEIMCPGLNCPPYIEGRELTCAVCSK